MFDIPLNLDGDWMLGLTSLEEHNSDFNITIGNKTIKICKHEEKVLNWGEKKSTKLNKLVFLLGLRNERRNIRNKDS